MSDFVDAAAAADASPSHRMDRWKRKLATLTPGSTEYKKHMKLKPVATPVTKSRGGKTRASSGASKSRRKDPNSVDWGRFTLTAKSN